MNLHSDHMHLGDAQFALGALAKLPGNHTLRCKNEYVEPLRELVEGTNITIDNCAHVPTTSIDCWIASGTYEKMGVQYRDDIDIMRFVAKYFNAMAIDNGFAPIFTSREDLLFDWPGMRSEFMEMYYPGMSFSGILFINADPKSGQCPQYSSSEMDALIVKTANAGHSICAVDGANLSLRQIGAMSIHAKLIVGCATGPWWPTMNIWNTITQRICMLSPMRLDYGSVPIVHAANAAEVEGIMKGMGFL